MVAAIGGILITIGAALIMRGLIYIAALVYLIADVCWMIVAYQTSNLFGIVTITIGTIFGFIAFMKMHSGRFYKTIIKGD